MKAGELRCPWCYSKHVYADFVDNGIGLEQCGPYGCENCHSYEMDYRMIDSLQYSPEERKMGWVQGTFMVWKTARQEHSNCMLFMRRMFKEIALIMRLQDPDYEISDDEVERVLRIAGWDELRTQRALNRIMEKLNA